MQPNVITTVTQGQAELDARAEASAALQELKIAQAASDVRFPDGRGFLFSREWHAEHRAQLAYERAIREMFLRERIAIEFANQNHGKE